MVSETNFLAFEKRLTKPREEGSAAPPPPPPRKKDHGVRHKELDRLSFQLDDDDRPPRPGKAGARPVDLLQLTQRAEFLQPPQPSPLFVRFEGGRVYQAF